MSSRQEAERLATDVVTRNLAVCVQIEGPIISHYRWKGALERAEEYRLCLKCLPGQLPVLENHVLTSHPYDTPEWLAIPMERVGEKYLSWAKANST